MRRELPKQYDPKLVEANTTLAPLPLTAVRVGVGALEALAIIKSRPLRREAPRWVGGG